MAGLAAVAGFEALAIVGLVTPNAFTMHAAYATRFEVGRRTRRAHDSIRLNRSSAPVLSRGLRWGSAEQSRGIPPIGSSTVSANGSRWVAAQNRREIRM